MPIFISLQRIINQCTIASKLFLYTVTHANQERGTFQLSLPRPVRPLPDEKLWQAMQLLHLCQAHVSARCLPLHFPWWQTRTNCKAKSALLGLLGNALVKYKPDKMLLFFSRENLRDIILQSGKQGFGYLLTIAFSASGLTVLLLCIWPPWHSTHFN